MKGWTWRHFFASILAPAWALRPEMHVDLNMERADETQGDWIESSQGTNLGTSVEMLMQAADSFFESADMMDERAEAEKYQMTAQLSSLGLQLQDRFRLFAVKHAFEMERKEQNQGFSLLEGLRPRRRYHKEYTKGELQAAMEHLKVGNAEVGCEDNQNLDRWLFDMKSIYGTRRAMGTAQHFRARKSLRNYCSILQIVKDKGKSIKVNEDDVKRLQQAASITNSKKRKTQEKLEPVQRGPIHHTEEEERNFHRADALRNLKWISNWNTSDVLRLKELYIRAIVMNKNLNHLVHFGAQSAEIDWLMVEAENETDGRASKIKEKLRKGTKKIGKITTAYLSRLGSNTLLFFSNCWSSFKRHLRNSERRCEKESEESSKKAAKSAGLPVRISDKAVSRTAEGLSRMEAGALLKEESTVDKAIDIAINDADAGSLSEEEAREKLGTVRKTARELREELDAGKLYKAEDMIDEVESSVCNTQRRSAFQRFKDMFRKSRELAKAGLRTTAPTLGIRGVGLSAFGVGGGLEEVIDFRNREIAQFRWGNGFFGASVGGMGLGGYAGVGWKGFKLNWTLQEAQVTGLWTSHALAASVFGLYAGLGVTFGTDADNSVQGPWIPEPHGMQSVTLGWSAGASITHAFLPVSGDTGASYYWYLNSECFDSLAEFIKYIWLPVCKDCEGASETAVISGLRLGIHAPSFPIISEMAFSVLAALYDRRVQDDEYKPECSPGSVTTRKNPSALLRQLGDLMFTNARLLEDLVSKWDTVVQSMGLAELHNPEMEESREYKKWIKAGKKEFDICPRQGPITEFLSKDTMNVYKEMSYTDLEGLCSTYETQSDVRLFCNAPGETRQSLEERLLNYENLKEGWLSIEDLRKLTVAVGSSFSVPGKILSQESSKCEMRNQMDNERNESRIECMPGLKALRVLEETMTYGKMLKVCQQEGLQCIQSIARKACRLCSDEAAGKVSKFCARCQTDREKRKQGMAMKILQVFGGGFIRHAGPDNPFGSCEKPEDCWLINTECSGQGSTKFCMCKVGFCYTLVKNIRNYADDKDFFPLCQVEPYSWRQIAGDMKRGFLSYRYTLGQMASEIKHLPVD